MCVLCILPSPAVGFPTAKPGMHASLLGPDLSQVLYRSCHASEQSRRRQPLCRFARVRPTYSMCPPPPPFCHLGRVLWTTDGGTTFGGVSLTSLTVTIRTLRAVLGFGSTIIVGRWTCCCI